MKKIFILIFLTSITLNLYSQKNKIKRFVSYHYDKKGIISLEYEYYKSNKQEIKHGEYKSFYKNGQLEYFAIYENGKLNDKALQYYPSGKLQNKTEYFNGKCKGVSTSFYENEEIMTVRSCDNDSIIRYGFSTGEYAIPKYSSDNIIYYELYDKSGKLQNLVKNNFQEIEDSSKLNCDALSKILKYPPMFQEKGLEGLVLFKITVDSKGKLQNVETIIGFHKKAIEESLKNIKKQECFPVRYKNGKPIDYSFYLDILYHLH